MNGGTLVAPAIQLENSGTFHHAGGVVSGNSSLMLAHGIWEAQPGTTDLGQVQLNVGTVRVRRCRFRPVRVWCSSPTVTAWCGLARQF